MKKIIWKNIKELILMVIIYFVVTFILSLIFNRNGFNDLTPVYLITLTLTKFIYTICACIKARKEGL